MIKRLALVAAALLALPVAANAKTQRPANPPRYLAEGQTFVVGGGPAGDNVRFYLSQDARPGLEDVRLLQPSPSTAARVMVPSMPVGRYRLLACTGDQCSASTGRTTVSEGPPSRIQAFSDTTDPSESDGNLVFDQGYQPTICPTRPPRQRVPSFAAALARARALLRHAATAQAWSAFARSAVYRSADRAESAAAEGVTMGKFGTALAASLRAAELDPSEPRYLIDAAGILTTLGAPADALAFLAHADELRLSGSQPFGLNEQALALNTKGEALIALGGSDEAEPLLRAALAIEPLLKEANLNLSVALLCQRRAAVGMRYLRAGQLRQPVITPTGVAAPALDQLLDMTHGVTPNLPLFPKPMSFEQAAAMAPMYASLDTQLRAEIQAVDERNLPRTWATDHPSQLSVQRSLDLQRLMNAPPQDLQAEGQRASDLTDTASNARFAMLADMTKGDVAWNVAAGTACASLRPHSESAYQACYAEKYDSSCLAAAEPMTHNVVDLTTTAEQATDGYLTHWYQYATALAANVSDPYQHELLIRRAEGDVLLTYDAVLEPLARLAADAHGNFGGCSSASVDVPAAVPGPTLPHSEACPASVKGVKLGWKLGADKAAGIPFDLSIDVNCEKISLEVGGSVSGWFGAFGQLDYSPRTGKLSVFAGPKASAKIPGTTLGASFKDGLYLTITNGGVSDFGFRTSASGSAGFGPFSIKGGDSMDFSFAPVFGLRG